MNSIAIGWKKQSPGEVQFLPNRQYFQHDSIRNIDDQGNKTNIKKVHFDFRTSTAKQHAFEDTEQDHSKTVRSEEFIFEDHDYIMSSPTNIFTTELSAAHAELICSVRATIITFIIIGLIVRVAAIAVGVVVGTIKTPESTTRTLIGNTNLNLSLTVSPIVMTSSVSVGSQSGASCSSYTTINDPSRNVAQVGLFGTCDNGPLFNTSSGGGAWIRFVDSGGTTIPLSPPGLKHCGGYISGWFNGTLPTTFGTMINGTMCFVSDIGIYFYTYDTAVIYCI